MINNEADDVLESRLTIDNALNLLPGLNVVTLLDLLSLVELRVFSILNDCRLEHFGFQGIFAALLMNHDVAQAEDKALVGVIGGWQVLLYRLE